jgi:SAM-dependent methyltransferase
MSDFKDHFSAQAASYARYRPEYPMALFEWLAGESPRRRLAWDCATGNGQAARALAQHFHQVVATDASPQQIAAAWGPENVEFRVATAEHSGLDDQGVDLISVAQALHWFDLNAFFGEAERVLGPSGILCAWTYHLMTVNEPVDAVVRHFYANIVGPYWPPERALVDSGYAGIQMPFPELSVPAFAMATEWDLRTLMGYLGTWSATQRYRVVEGHDPLALIETALGDAWGEPEQPREVRWPLHVRAARKPGWASGSG